MVIQPNLGDAKTLFGWDKLEIAGEPSPPSGTIQSVGIAIKRVTSATN